MTTTAAQRRVLSGGWMSMAPRERRDAIQQAWTVAGGSHAQAMKVLRTIIAGRCHRIIRGF